MKSYQLKDYFIKIEYPLKSNLNIKNLIIIILNNSSIEDFVQALRDEPLIH